MMKFRKRILNKQLEKELKVKIMKFKTKKLTSSPESIREKR